MINKAKHFNNSTGNVWPDYTKSRGFTLLEVLVSIFIFSIVVITILGAHNLIISNTDSINKGMKYYEMGKTCLNRMVTDLQSVYISMPPSYKKYDINKDHDQYRFYGTVSDGNIDFPQLRFTSLAHLPFERGMENGICEIVYYIQTDDEGKNIIRRKDTFFKFEDFEESGFDPILCEDVKSFEFIYYDEENEEFDYWDSDSQEYSYATPGSVEFKLEIGDEDFSVNFTTRVSLPVSRGKIE